MNWFKRHLNWTYLLGLLVGGSFQEGASTLYYAESPDRTAGLILVWTGAIILVGITVWVLKQKGRSLWILLIGILGILPIVILCLRNKRREQDENATIRNKITT